MAGKLTPDDVEPPTVSLVPRKKLPGIHRKPSAVAPSVINTVQMNPW